MNQVKSYFKKRWSLTRILTVLLKQLSMSSRIADLMQRMSPIHWKCSHRLRRRLKCCWQSLITPTRRRYFLLILGCVNVHLDAQACFYFVTSPGVIIDSYKIISCLQFWNGMHGRGVYLSELPNFGHHFHADVAQTYKPPAQTASNYGYWHSFPSLCNRSG